jgi:hypothetical protein
MRAITKLVPVSKLKAGLANAEGRASDSEVGVGHPSRMFTVTGSWD